VIYSKKLNLIFIHQPKAAGTTILNLLKSLTDDLTCLAPHHNGLYDFESKQKIYSKCPCGLPNGWANFPFESKIEEFKIFAVYRNPVDIWKSHYNWGKRIYKIYGEHKSLAPFINVINRVRSNGRQWFTGFEDFCEKGLDGKVGHNAFHDHCETSFHKRILNHHTIPSNLKILSFNNLNVELVDYFNSELGISNISNRIRASNKSKSKTEFLMSSNIIKRIKKQSNDSSVIKSDNFLS